MGLLMALGLACMALLVAATAGAPATASSGQPTTAARSNTVSANGESSSPAISAHGRFVAFQSKASNLVDGDTNHHSDVFVRDRRGGTIRRVSVSSAGGEANGGSGGATISADGRFVAFGSDASNLVAGDTNGSRDVFVRDRVAGTTSRVSVSSSGEQANANSFRMAISANGHFVTFGSKASNLVADDTNGNWDVFVRDRVAGTTTRVSINSSGEQVNSDSSYPVISADGRFVAFDSGATNLAARGNKFGGPFVRDRRAGTTEAVDLNTSGAGANGVSYGPTIAISADGRFVGFQSEAWNLVAGDTNNRVDVFIRDRVAGTTSRVSVSSKGAQANLDSGRMSISADGRFVAFESEASNLVAGSRTFASWDIFVRDRSAGTTKLVSVGIHGGQHVIATSSHPAISADGRFVAFDSNAPNLVTEDTNANGAVFVRDRVTSTTTLASVGRTRH